MLHHDSRKLERSYYRRVQAAILIAVVLHALTLWLSPPYVPRPYTLDATPLRLVASGTTGARTSVTAEAAPARAKADSPASQAPRRSAPVITEQLWLSPQATPEPSPPAEGRASGGSGAPGLIPGGSDVAGSEEMAPPVFYAFDAPPRVLERVVPEYPASAKAQGGEGSVILNANVDERGRVMRVWVAQATAPEILVEAAVDALYRFRFSPGSQQGIPVKCTVAVPFNFQLNVHL